MRRPLLLPLVPLYLAGLRVKAALHDLGAPRVRRLSRPVVSVGSLSAGGAGKTPVVIMLAKLLVRHGIRPDVLSRGYGRQSDAVEEVAGTGGALRYGDEPVEIRRNGIRVFVGSDRFMAGKLGEASYGGDVDVHLLDDGFQHRKLARNLEIVLLTREDVDDCLLPAGNRRETLASLRRADVVVLREEEAENLRGIVANRTQAEIWVIRRRLVVPPTRPQRPLVFCGIARPEGFLSMLEQAGVQPADTVFFRDHHRYSEADFRRIIDEARRCAADGFCTTRKDFTKIPRSMVDEMLKVGQLWPAQLRVKLLDEDTAVRRVRAAMKSS